MASTRKVTATKKLGLEGSATRAAFLDAAERLIRQQGFGGLTSRTLAAEAGLKAQSIHYYFASMEDLYVEVFRRGAEGELSRIAATLEADQPLQALWKLTKDPRSTRFVTEFMALANHSDLVRAEITRHADRRRELQAKVVAKHFANRGVVPTLPPVVIAVLIENIARGLVLESSLDIDMGHEETESFVGSWLQRFDELAAAAPPSADRRPRPSLFSGLDRLRGRTAQKQK